MKTKRLLALIPLLFAPLYGCNKNNDNNQNNIRLTYGTEIEQKVASLKELSNDQLFDKTFNEGEVFLLATYQGSYSEDCLCWSSFKEVVATYMNNNDEIIYIFDAEKQSDSIKELEITKYEDSTPALYIFNGKEKIASFNYKNKKDRNLFEDKTGNALKDRIHKYVNAPLLIYVEPEYIKDNETVYHDSGAVLFVRSGCNDCKYVLPNVIIPYINQREHVSRIRVIDLQDLYDLSKKESATDEEKKLYQNTKDACHLSETGSNTYGYQQGVVPTIQYYEKGSLVDASVYFNDVVSKKDDESYYISDSFYSEERLTSLKYILEREKAVLKGMSLDKDDVVDTGDYIFWRQEKAAQYHTPLFTAFLDCYCTYELFA